MSDRVRTGADRLAAEGFRRLAGQRVGLVCNQTAVRSDDLAHLADLVHASPVDLVALFAPEHGVRGEAQDMVGVDETRDRETGLLVHSLYGHTVESLKPTREMLEGLDTLVFDIQDVGSRYYTFAATMALCLDACREAGVRVVVLDRPNPLGGVRVEGGGIDPGFESFVGLYSIPVRHGMTVGELALYYNEVEELGAELEVVWMEGWDARRHFGATGLCFVPPSPNMPAVETAVVYPGMCLVEGTELSEGRGTTRPFEQVGAPWIEGAVLARELEDAMTRHRVDGVLLRTATFLPTFQKHAGTPCEGVFLHVVEPECFQAHRFGLLFLDVVHRRWPDRFEWRHRAYEFVDEVPAVDLLTGSARFREVVERGSGLADYLREQDAFSSAFLEKRAPYLYYPRPE